MKLLTKEILQKFEKQGSVNDVPDTDAKVICKFFTPDANATWYALEYDPRSEEFFGFADLGNPDFAEFGYFTLEQLESVKGKLGLPVERDMHFEDMTVKQLKEKYNISW